MPARAQLTTKSLIGQYSIAQEYSLPEATKSKLGIVIFFARITCLGRGDFVLSIDHGIPFYSA